MQRNIKKNKAHPKESYGPSPPNGGEVLRDEYKYSPLEIVAPAISFSSVCNIFDK